ncbi:hypothetical protein OIU79_017563 [Salix purpurea]|uniref:Uncharacterized protein n=2 Tax=Salix TaxID=40685 RepID=A0A9Q0WW53_SALPP|nr:hypothetical protein OIU79_017563 [Salix purpurea]
MGTSSFLQGQRNGSTCPTDCIASFLTLLGLSAGSSSLKLLLWNVKGELARHLLTAEFNMMVSWRQKFLLFTLLAFIVLASDASRLPGAYWEQMLPKKLPTPSSSPSKGTNSVSRSYSTTIKSDSDLSSTDGKV